MNTLLPTVLTGCLVAYALLFIFVQVRRAGRLWLSLTILLGAAVTGVALLPVNAIITENIRRGFVITMALAALLVIFGALVIHDTAAHNERKPFPVRWLILGVLWLGLLIGISLTTDQMPVGESEWLVHVFSQPTPTGVVTLGGFALLSLILLSTAFSAFYNATLPEVANRALFWVLVIAVELMGIVLFVSGAEAMTLVGGVTILVGIVGAAYAKVSYRVLDIRAEFGTAAQAVMLLLLTTVVMFFGIALTASFNLAAQGVVPLIALAAALAALYLLLYQLAVLVSARLSGGSHTDPAEATRRYSLQISNALELDSLIEIATRTINAVMRVRRAAVIVVTATEGSNTSLELYMLPHYSDVKSARSYLATNSPLYEHFAKRHAPVSQFELQFNPRFKNVPESEQQYFRDTGMSAYAPIIAENRLIGILACGAKTDDVQFYPHDLTLLATLANQTGTALRNARLVSDLRRLNTSAKALNTNLEAAKEQMEKLDSVKTDFITIASHELRTPLAQIRGYTDIMDAMNEEGMLEADQITGMVNNLRKATERMEELITAMLDVSQLDVDAMDLRFAQTAMESVVRMAIEPLNDAIRQRKLSLSARGLRGLPAIQGDLQRLVQAVRNIVVNAIKFTPDGGRIEITASVRPANRPGEKDHVLIAISDSGVGIEKDNLELIFRKFYRTYDPTLHSTGAYKFMGAGPGLGLTIAKGIIEGHGGEIWAESTGHNMETFPGTTFYILLPVTPPETAGRVKPFEGDLPEAISQEPTLVRTQM